MALMALERKLLSAVGGIPRLGQDHIALSGSLLVLEENFISK
jgi:hypothetical protein